MITNLLNLHHNDINEVFDQDKQIEIRCDYCNTLYEISKEDLTNIQQLASPSGSCFIVNCSKSKFGIDYSDHHQEIHEDFYNFSSNWTYVQQPKKTKVKLFRFLFMATKQKSKYSDFYHHGIHTA